jgi:hypothetical protein
MNPKEEAEKIASEIAGQPVSIRFVSAPRTQTGFSDDQNVVGSLFVYILGRSRRPSTGGQGETVQIKGPRPPEFDAGMGALIAAGAIVPASAPRGWEGWKMPDPALRSAFENWDAENQERESPDWEQWVYDGVEKRFIRAAA